MITKISPAFLEGMSTPEFKEWIYTFTGSGRMKLQYNPDDVDFSGIYEDYDPDTNKLNADNIIQYIITKSPFPGRPLKSQLATPLKAGDTTVGDFEGNVRTIRISDIGADHKINDVLPLFLPKCKSGNELQDQDLLLARIGSIGKTALFMRERERERERERAPRSVRTMVTG